MPNRFHCNVVKRECQLALIFQFLIKLLNFSTHTASNLLICKVYVALLTGNSFYVS